MNPDVARTEDLPVCVENLVHRYDPDGPPAVNGLSFTVRPGEIVGLLGPNGAGKTTTLHIILGLLKPTSGNVSVFGGSPIRDRSRVMPRINFASVDVELPGNLTVAECLNVYADLYTVPDSKRRISNLLERLHFSGKVSQRISTLSSGEQMRLRICKGLLNAPDLLILDEPTRSLDPYMAHQVRAILKEVRRERNMTILHTSHNMQEVESFCDRILFLNAGKVLAEGSPREVLERFQTHSLEELFIRVSASGELYEVNGE